MTTPEFTRRPEHYAELEAERFRAELHRLKKVHDSLRSKAVRLTQRAGIDKMSGISDESFDSMIRSVISCVNYRAVGALCRLKAIQRLFPDCSEPIQVFAGERCSAVDRRAAVLIKMFCEKRGLKVRIDNRLGFGGNFCVSVVTKRRMSLEKLGLVDRAFGAISSVWSAFFPPEYNREMALRRTPKRIDRYLGVCAYVAGYNAGFTRILGLWGMSVFLTRGVQSGSLDLRLLSVAVGVFCFGHALAGAHRSLVHMRLGYRLSNPENY